MKTAVLAAAAMLSAGCSPAGVREAVPGLGIAELLADPSTHHGSVAWVRGAALVRFEASFICPTPDHFERGGKTKACLALVPGEVDGGVFDIRPLDGKIVEIVGRFNAHAFGHMGAYGGMIAVSAGTVIASHDMTELPPPPPGAAHPSPPSARLGSGE